MGYHGLITAKVNLCLSFFYLGSTLMALQQNLLQTFCLKIN